MSVSAILRTTTTRTVAGLVRWTASIETFPVNVGGVWVPRTEVAVWRNEDLVSPATTPDRLEALIAADTLCAPRAGRIARRLLGG